MTPVTSSDVAATLVRRAAVARACEATAMNATSSRSHSVFMLAITGRHEASGTTLRGALNLVDLAGRCVLSTWKQGEPCSLLCSLSVQCLCASGKSLWNKLPDIRGSMVCGWR